MSWTLSTGKPLATCHPFYFDYTLDFVSLLKFSPLRHPKKLHFKLPWSLIPHSVQNKLANQSYFFSSSRSGSDAVCATNIEVNLLSADSFTVSTVCMMKKKARLNKEVKAIQKLTTRNGGLKTELNKFEFKYQIRNKKTNKQAKKITPI